MGLAQAPFIKRVWSKRAVQETATKQGQGGGAGNPQAPSAAQRDKGDDFGSYKVRLIRLASEGIYIEQQWAAPKLGVFTEAFVAINF